MTLKLMELMAKALMNKANAMSFSIRTQSMSITSMAAISSNGYKYLQEVVCGRS